MQYFFIITLLLLSFNFSYSQKNIDSLEILKYYNEGKQSWGKKDYNASVENWTSELNLKIKYHGENHFETSRTYHNLGSAYYEQSLNKKAIHNYEKALEIRIVLLQEKEEKELINLTKKTYKQLIKLYFEIGDYDKALLLYKNCLSVLKTSSNDIPEIGVYVAQVYEKKGGIHIDKAIEKYKESISFFESKKDMEHMGKTLLDLGNAYEQKNDFDNAEKAYLQSFDILYNDVGVLSEEIFYVSNNLGSFYIQKGNLDEAKKYLDEAMDIAQALSDENYINQHLLAYPNENLGNYYTKKGDLTKGLEHHEKAINYIIPNFNEIKTNPTNHLEDETELQGLKSDAIDILFSRSQCLYDLNRKKDALDNYIFIDKIIFSLRQDINTEASSLHWIQKTRDIYEAAIQLALELNEKEKAFSFIEKSKSVLLFENLQKTQKINISQLPNTLQEERENLLESILINQNKVSLYPNKKDSLKTIIETYKNELSIFDKNNFNESLLNIKYDDNTLINFQKHLSSNHSISLVFFGNTNNLIAAVISGEEIYYHTYNTNKNREENITRWTQEISKPKSNITKSEIQQLNELSFNIYTDLIQPLNIPKEKKLIIIPDGILQFIPFEALLTEATNNTDFSSNPYFLKSNPIQYAYSAGVQLELANKKNYPKDELLIFAPREFNNLADLNSDETQKIKALFNAELLENDDATTTAFLKNAVDYNILHLSTHAFGGNKETSPWIAFKDRKLNLSELYNLQLNTQLVTLSACETGKGEIIQGEGVMSLARGFSFAGVTQVVTSLWEVNENSTNQIMELFYGYIHKGEVPSLALHHAKLDYLNSHSLSDASPYHWAAFNAWGHDSYNNTSEGTNIWFWFVVVSIGILCFSLFRKKKKA